MFVIRSTSQLLLASALRFSRALVTASSYLLHKEFMGFMGAPLDRQEATL